MNNKDRQKWCDTTKWQISNANSCDMSGKMYWCSGCEKSTDFCDCLATQIEREEKSLCAKAYNRYYKSPENKLTK